MVLSEAEVERFVRDGFVHLPEAFSPATAAACVDELWALLPADRDDRSTWTEPVLRVLGAASPALVEAINDDRLCGAIDDLVGAGRWQRRRGHGSFPVRFPSALDPGDTGWHVDGSYEVLGEPPPWNHWVNLRSRGRALLVLMLYSDVGPEDAPTRVRAGSHHDVARTLVHHGEAGASVLTITQTTAVPEERPVVTATGDAGDAYLCHPFLLHAASWPHRGTAPRFLGQPCIHFAGADDGYRCDRPAAERSPCERAVVEALGRRRVADDVHSILGDLGSG